MPDADEAAWIDLVRQLAASRRAAGIRQHDLAKLTGYSHSTIANAETVGQHVPPSVLAEVRQRARHCDSAHRRS